MRGKIIGLKKSNLVESTKDVKNEGAAFLAVCRGKVIQAILLYHLLSTGA